MNTPQKHMIGREIIADNEAAAQAAFQRGDYVCCFFLLHSLIESLLRKFLGKNGEKLRFTDLIKAYERYLIQEGQTEQTFVKELTEFNRRRNRVIHQLWEKGYTATNSKLSPVCQTAIRMYGLFIEWLETLDSEITEVGFEYNQ